MGHTYLLQGSASEAIEAYRRSIDFENSSATRIDLAEACLQNQRLDESLSVVTDVLVADPQSARAWYVHGKVWMAKKRYDNAVISFQHVLSLQQDPAASYLLGAAFLQLKDANQAKAAFRALPERIGQTDVQTLLEDARHAANVPDERERELKPAQPGAKAAGQNSSPMDAVMADATRLGSSLESVKPARGNRAQITRLQVELKTILASAFNDLGTTEARQEHFPLALAHFHEAEHWNPDLPSLLRNVGIAASRAGDYPECIRALRPVLAKNPADSVVRAMLGTALFATQSYSDAAAVFTPLGDSVLQLHELAYSWAASLVRINKYREATALLNKLLEQSNLSTDTLILVAQLWSQMGNYQQTVETCHRALQLDPKLLRAHYIAGLALLHLDRPADAAKELRDELQLDANDVDTQFHLAFSLLQQSQNEEAIGLLKSVLSTNPDHAEANYELGKELMEEGKAAEALSYLEAATRLKPQFEPAHYQLQSAYRAVGRRDDADREAKVYRALKAKSRNITLPAPHQPPASE